jgi:hypothetical protein
MSGHEPGGQPSRIIASSQVVAQFETTFAESRARSLAPLVKTRGLRDDVQGDDAQARFQTEPLPVLGFD